MLQDVESSASTEFEEGRMLGHEEQRARLIQMVHDAVSPTMLGAIFAIESLKQTMKAENLPHAEIASRASELLAEAIEKLSDVLEGSRHAEPASAGST
jgi:signal transduction histidine kinase